MPNYSAIEYNVRLLWGFTQKWSAISYDMDTGAWTSGKYLNSDTETTPEIKEAHGFVYIIIISFYDY